MVFLTMHMRTIQKHRHGFSLVELSIVLVILGLLTGGILGGQSLIRAAELRSVGTQFAQYRTAVYTFRDKYFALPGDMQNATAFWQSAGGNGGNAACMSAQTTARATCNGTGDGLVTGLPDDAWAERFLAWKHLANAGLVEGSYLGRTNGAVNSYETVAGTNVPTARVGSGFFDIAYNFASPTLFHAQSSTNRNAVNMYGTQGLLNGTLTPEEAWNVDTKLDDGLPYRGMLYTMLFSFINCPVSDAADATYNLQLRTKNCTMFYAF